ncbi:ankyrin repeat-containing protein ITN1-like [Cornus florida]|uniref:ankyrin repeat-containing protein ITN1-like n=1 Tax=Cornus florida TaxID=4283 RepID=UPI002896E23C|nr:ankyrin repeat-containing protein ITN1-like [Cornus florida]
MKKKNMEAHELLSKMCSPRWTFDSKYVGVYFEAIKKAIKCGNVEFVEEVLRSNPALLWGDEDSGSIFHIAVAWREEKIWNLIYGLNTQQRNKIAGRLVKSNTILHIAACPLVTDDRYIGGGLLSKEDSKNQGEQQSQPKVFSKARDAAMKMQRELQWYEEVKRMVPSSYKLKANNHGETPSDLHASYHNELLKEGEQWMRDTAGSFTIVAALIVTVMFAAAFTLPGGTDESGNPVFLKYTLFMVYAIANAISLLTSTTSLLMFLSIITSRYIQQSFRWSLHTRLIIGLTTLFISIATMMVAFGVTLIMELGKRISWSTTPITLFAGAASVPAIIFGWLQLPLFVNLVLSTYGQGLFKQKTKCPLFHNLHDPPKLE